MAILKHIASKNADYGEAQRYLIFQYDESTKKPLLDENGHLQPRDCLLYTSSPDTLCAYTGDKKIIKSASIIESFNNFPESFKSKGHFPVLKQFLHPRQNSSCSLFGSNNTISNLFESKPFCILLIILYPLET